MKFQLATLIGLLTTATLLAQCPANLSVSNGSTGTWVNTASGVATVRITAVGAGGGKNTQVNYGDDGQVGTLNGGAGATIIGTFTVAAGASVFVISGKAGANSANAGAGGGASGAVNCGNPSNCGTGAILLIAGGGGGTSGFFDGGGGRSTSGGGGGGDAPENAGGGGGLNAAGTNGINGATGGGQVSKTAISNGGAAGNNNGEAGAAGGNGMGGGGATDGGAIAGGGGGQTGGDAESLTTEAFGGYSLNTGTNQTNTAGADGGANGAGSVLVECLSVLPIELVSFNAKLQDQTSVMLSWETASEHNNAGFEVERSSNGSAWTNLGFVQGLNASAEYVFNDAKPMSGMNYYRLRQIDFDGKFDYSPIVSAQLKSTTGGWLQVFPNPAQGRNINLLIPADIETEVTAKLYDQTGQLVRTWSLQSGLQPLDVADLPQGVYTLQTLIGGVMEVNRLVLGE